MKIEVYSSSALNSELPAKTYDGSQGGGGNFAPYHGRDSQDVFSQKADITEELEIYEKYKSSPIDMPYEFKTKLEELLNALQRSKQQVFDLDRESAQHRDELINRIEELFRLERAQGEKRLQNMLLVSAFESYKTQTDGLDARIKEMKKLQSCMEIAAKISAGTASEEEIRFLVKTSPSMYAMAIAMARSAPPEDEDERKTTVNLDFEDERSHAMGGNMEGTIGSGDVTLESGSAVAVQAAATP